jgi:hypothetical protein
MQPDTEMGLEQTARTRPTGRSAKSGAQLVARYRLLSFVLVRHTNVCRAVSVLLRQEFVDNSVSDCDFSFSIALFAKGPYGLHAKRSKRVSVSFPYEKEKIVSAIAETQ